MFRTIRKRVGAVALVAGLALAPAVSAVADQYWQCVPFARLTSGIQIFGDAWTWWQQASNKYDKGFSPKAGAVLCFRPHGSMKLGHVAVVSQVLTDRVIQVTHANWSIIGGTRGKIERDVTVVDVSPQGDWSSVKVWYNPIQNLGTSSYPTYGFIYPGANDPSSGSALAKAQSITMAAAQGAANSVASVVTPGSSGLSSLAGSVSKSETLTGLIQSAVGQ